MPSSFKVTSVAARISKQSFRVGSSDEGPSVRSGLLAPKAAQLCVAARTPDERRAGSDDIRQGPSCGAFEGAFPNRHHPPSARGQCGLVLPIADAEEEVGSDDQVKGYAVSKDNFVPRHEIDPRFGDHLILPPRGSGLVRNG